ASVVGNTYKSAFFGVGVDVAGLAALGTGLAIYSGGGWRAFARVLAPYSIRTSNLGTKAAGQAGKVLDNVDNVAKTASASFRAASAIGSALVVFEVITNIISFIQVITEAVELNNIPSVLKALVRAAAGPTETSVHIQPGGTGDAITTG